MKIIIETREDAEELAQILSRSSSNKHDIAFLNCYAAEALRNFAGAAEGFKNRIVKSLKEETKAFFCEVFAEEKEEPKEEVTYKVGDRFRYTEPAYCETRSNFDYVLLGLPGKRIALYQDSDEEMCYFLNDTIATVEDFNKITIEELEKVSKFLQLIKEDNENG